MSTKVRTSRLAPPDQRAVHVRLGHQVRDVVRLDAAAVDDVAQLSRILPEPLRSRLRMCACASAACAGVAFRPVPIAQTGS